MDAHGRAHAHAAREAIPVWRRCVVAIVPVLFAALIFRGQVAEAIAARGDEYFQVGDLAGAQRYYERALHVDPTSSIAVERVTTLALFARTSAEMARGITAATTELAVHPGDDLVRQNRALLYQKLHNPEAAERDLRIVAMRSTSAALVEYTARAEARRGNRGIAKELYRRVLAIDPARASARAALRRLEAGPT